MRLRSVCQCFVLNLALSHFPFADRLKQDLAEESEAKAKWQTTSGDLERELALANAENERGTKSLAEHQAKSSAELAAKHQHLQQLQQELRMWRMSLCKAPVL